MQNPTEAKEIAIEFLKLIGTPPNRASMGRTITSIYKLQEAGYTKQDIEYTINVCFARVPSLYSFGYIVQAIEQVIKEREEEKKRKAKPVELTELVQPKVDSESEVIKADDATARNRDKAKGIGIQSGKREKSYLDLFEE